MKALTVSTFHQMKFGSRTSLFTTSKYFMAGHGKRISNIGEWARECGCGWRRGGSDERSCVCVFCSKWSPMMKAKTEMSLICTNTELQWPSRSTALLLSIKNVITYCFAFIYSGDDQIKLAGGPGKFVTDVAVKYDGLNTWSGPATFKANCDMQVDKWPFDEQNCSLAFVSFTYGENLLRIKTFKAKNQLTSKK